jgi:hypothetical protein
MTSNQLLVIGYAEASDAAILKHWLIWYASQSPGCKIVVIGPPSIVGTPSVNNPPPEPIEVEIPGALQDIYTSFNLDYSNGDGPSPGGLCDISGWPVVEQNDPYRTRIFNFQAVLQDVLTNDNDYKSTKTFWTTCIDVKDFWYTTEPSSTFYDIVKSGTAAEFRSVYKLFHQVTLPDVALVNVLEDGNPTQHYTVSNLLCTQARDFVKMSSMVQHWNPAVGDTSYDKVANHNWPFRSIYLTDTNNTYVPYRHKVNIQRGAGTGNNFLKLADPEFDPDAKAVFACYIEDGIIKNVNYLEYSTMNLASWQRFSIDGTTYTIKLGEGVNEAWDEAGDSKVSLNYGSLSDTKIISASFSLTGDLETTQSLIRTCWDYTAEETVYGPEHNPSKFSDQTTNAATHKLFLARYDDASAFSYSTLTGDAKKMVTNVPQVWKQAGILIPPIPSSSKGFHNGGT